MYVILLPLLLSYSLSITSDIKNITLVVLRPGYQDGTNQFNADMGAGAKVAIDYVNEQQPIPGHYITPEYIRPGCNESNSLEQIVAAYAKFKPDGFIGPECSKSVESIALLARGWDVSMVSYGASTPTVSKPNKYTTFARSIPPYNLMGSALVALFKHYSWNKVCIMTSVREIWLETANQFKHDLEEAGIEVFVKYTFGVSDESTDDIKEQLLESVQSLRSTARIIVLLMYNDYEVLEHAYSEGMLNGDYVFLLIEGSLHYLNEGLEESDKGWTETEIAEVTNGLLSVTYQPPEDSEKFNKFKDDLDKAVKQPPFNTTEGRGAKLKAEYTYEAFIHDAVILFAKGLNATVNGLNATLSGLNATVSELPKGVSGVEIRSHIANNNFSGVSGDLIMNSNGDRGSNFIIQNLQDNQFQPVYIYYQLEPDVVKRTQYQIMFHGGTTTAPNSCGAHNELCIIEKSDTFQLMLTLLVTAGVCLLIFSSVTAGWRWHTRRKIMRRSWEIKMSDVVFLNQNITYMSAVSLPSAISHRQDENGHSHAFSDTKAIINNKTIFMKRTQKQHVTINMKMLRECQELLEARHPNVVEFVGLCLAPGNIFIATAFCSKKSLQDIIADERVSLDMMFKMSLSTDLAKGIAYIHRTDIGYHGNLTSTNCVVDDHWTLKVTDFGIRCLRITLGESSSKMGSALKEDRLWKAPELLQCTKHHGSPQGDIYSVGIILQEIMCEDYPYPNVNLSTEEILEKVAEGYRPKIVHDHATEEFILLTESCWSHDPEDRPQIHDVRNKLQELNPDRRMSLTDRMMALMNRYTTQLETLVEERTQQLAEEKGRCDQLLYQMLPRAVAEKLKLGQPVLAEAYESVSIYFSDIVGFTDLSSRSTPFQVVEMLNDLYTVFDSIADKFDCYKVETIGDAYMVVSGIPNRNGDNHSSEIAHLALDLLKSISSFTVRHLAGEKLKLRIGLHSGACAAGVVGLKMPRYCLFGDTVNTASRMESTGLPLRIHMSEDIKLELDKHKTFVIEERGIMEIKGKGRMMTYFLNGKVPVNLHIPAHMKLAQIARIPPEETFLAVPRAPPITVLPHSLAHQSEDTFLTVPG